MRRKIRKASSGGVITVYLALTLLLILSLILTVIEGARVNTAKVYAKRALSTAMDSVWAEYYGPLWKEYHIFGYAAGEGNDCDKAERIEEKLTQYMSYTLQPNTDLHMDADSMGIELYDINIASLSVTNQAGIMDYRGELLRKEAVEYMKYHELAGGFTLLLEKLSLLEEPKKVSAVYDRKLEAEEELAKADRNILRLMELLDGVKTTKKGIKLDGNGRLIVTDNFTKRLCSTPISMEAVGINHTAVYEAVKDRYVNPVNIVSRITSELEQLGAVQEQQLQVREELDDLQTAINSLRDQLQSAQDAGNTRGVGERKESKEPKESEKTNESNEQQEALVKEINKLQEQISNLYTRAQELSEQKRQLSSSTEGSLKSMNHILQKLMPIVDEAVYEAEQVILNATSSADLIEDFEESLYSEEANIDREIFINLEEGLEEMKRYSSGYEENESFYQMYDLLDYNSILLMNAQKAAQKALDYLCVEDYPAALNSSIAVRDELQQYKIDDLVIDYSTLVLDPEKQRSPIKEIGTLIGSGITGLILDPESISSKELPSKQLPSQEAALSEEAVNFEERITSFFEDAITGGEANKMGNLLFDFQDSTQLSSSIEEGVERITEQLLYQEYLMEHFESYPVGANNLTDRKPSIIAYELEYLLAGKTSDRENLASILSRIVFLRMIMNFVTLLGDKTRCEEAKLAAVAIVGFTGLPMLINITQAILLMVWSFAEALVDTCALLMGKELPIRKQKLVLQFPELFLLNRSFLRSKAESLTVTKQFAFSYTDYLRMFLLIKNNKELTGHSMDLIQENLNLRYEEKIDLRDCLFGFDTSAVYTIDTRFIAIPFLRNYINHKLTGYQFSCKAAYSY